MNKKKHGGHQTGFRPIKTSVGHGPVFEIQAVLGLSQRELAQKVGCSRETIQNAQAAGRWPTSRAVQSNLRGLAEEAGIDLSKWPLPDSGGVFL